MKKQINDRVEYIKNLTGLNLYADYNSTYGGWRLVIISNTGSHIGCFGKSESCARLKSKEFYQFLVGICAGIETLHPHFVSLRDQERVY